MTDNQKQVRDWMKAFGQETPKKPTIPSLEVRLLRAKLHVEECLESVRALGIALRFNYMSQHDTQIESINNIVFDTQMVHYKDNEAVITYLKPNLELIADGCEDLKVVTEGTLAACGLVTTELLTEKQKLNGWNEEDLLFDEVMRSNNTKFWTREEINEKFKDEDGFEKADHDGWIFEEVLGLDSTGDYRFLVKDRNGKVIKSPSYSPANLQPIIEEMSK